jgi:alpha-L-arabinofuranosidase
MCLSPRVFLVLIPALLWGQLRYEVTPKCMAVKPVSHLLASHFIELGYGFQIEPMMAEMLFNRSFEPYMPYRDNSLTWFGLWRNEKDHSQGYRTDWRELSWYHSGYEHNSWIAAPGSEGPFSISQSSTFFLLRSPVRKVRLELVHEARHGIQAVRLVNEDTSEWGALAQDGKYLRRGETYRFRGLLRSEGRPVGAEIRFYPRGNWERPIAVLPLPGIGSDYVQKSATFRNADFEGYATFSLWIPAGASVVADDFSLLPASAFHGWREDVIRTIEQLRPGLFRFPGGCFASFYDWRNGVGPLSGRKPDASYFWGGMNYNDLGTDEFAAMCERVGAEMMLAVNLYHPAKRDYLRSVPNKPPENSTHSFDMSRFTELEQGAREAAAWVAYCNLPAGRHAMADLRAANGFRRPWGVKFWELDNETYRWFTAEEYAKAAVVYSRAMKAVDPTIRIGLVTYGRFRPHVAALLEAAGHDIDFLADRTDSEEGLDSILAVMRGYNQRRGRRLFYANTEWLPRETVERQRADNAIVGISRAELWDRMSRWRTGLVVLANMMSWQRRGGDVAWVNFNNLANTHAQSAVETPKESAFLTACGVAMSAIARSPAAWPLRIAGYEPRVADDFQVQAAWDADRKRLVLFALNRTGEPRGAVFGLSALGRTFRRASASVALAAGAEARNTPEDPVVVRREVGAPSAVIVRGEYSVVAAPWSFTEIILK